jgi:CDP-paratose 2-epimerase
MSCIAGPRQFGNEDQGWVAHFVYSALQGKAISIYGDGHQIRDVLAVQDLVRAFAAARDHRTTTAGQVYNIGGGPGNATSLLELVSAIERALHVRVKYRLCAARPGDQPIYVTDFTKFSQHTRWRPERRLSQTIDDISRWYNANRPIFVPTEFPVPASKAPIESIGGIAS